MTTKKNSKPASKPDNQVTITLIQVVGALLTALIGFLGILAANGYFKPKEAPTPTLLPTLTAAPAATFTLAPSSTLPPPTETSTPTVAPPALPTSTDTPAPTALPPCEWDLYKNERLFTPEPSECMDTEFNSIGVDGDGDEKFAFSVSNNANGYFGIVKALGAIAKLEKGFVFTAKINLKQLTAGRFIVAVGPNPRPDAKSSYAVVISPEGTQLSTKFLFYKMDGAPNPIYFAGRPERNSLQGVDYTIKFTLSYPSIKVDVNDGAFKPNTAQIEFTGNTYIFIGYQRISTETSRTDIDGEVEIP
jgi:hypothetical protein